MLSSKRYIGMMEKIVSIYVDCGISSLPFDCFTVLKFYGFRIFTYSQLRKQNLRLYNIMTAYTQDSLIWGDIIAYNEKAAPNRIRFSLMHEFGHYVFGHEEDGQKEENEADMFAASILAPYILIHKFKCKNANQIHDTFGLSYMASNKALLSYKEWFRNISYSTTRKPTEPEQQLEHIFFPEPNLVPLMEGIVQPAKECYAENDEDELDEHSNFMKFLGRWRRDLGFGIAEDKWLYGNDL